MDTKNAEVDLLKSEQEGTTEIEADENTANEANGEAKSPDEKDGKTKTMRRGSRNKSESSASSMEEAGTELGTIRFLPESAAEQVYVGDGKWVNTIRIESEAVDMGQTEQMIIVSKKRAGKTVFAKSGNAIHFDANGRAEVSAEDGLYPKGLPDCIVEK